MKIAMYKVLILIFKFILITCINERSATPLPFELYIVHVVFVGRIKVSLNFFFFFKKIVLLCSPGCPGIGDLPAAASRLPRLQACTVSVYGFRISFYCQWRAGGLEMGIALHCVCEARCGLDVIRVYYSLLGGQSWLLSCLCDLR